MHSKNARRYHPHLSFHQAMAKRLAKIYKKASTPTATPTTTATSSSSTLPRQIGARQIGDGTLLKDMIRKTKRQRTDL
jgi:hypothetical protein